MNRPKDRTKKTSLRSYKSKQIDGDTNPVDEQVVASDIDSLTLPKTDEYKELAIPEKINASHQFIADGQECICVTETIPPKK
jgi:hypothetical protein